MNQEQPRVEEQTSFDSAPFSTVSGKFFLFVHFPIKCDFPLFTISMNLRLNIMLPCQRQNCMLNFKNGLRKD